MANLTESILKFWTIQHKVAFRYGQMFQSHGRSSNASNISNGAMLGRRSNETGILLTVQVQVIDKAALPVEARMPLDCGPKVDNWHWSLIGSISSTRRRTLNVIGG